MIKLIATDMDGTLLDENGHLPEGFTEVLDLITKKDVKFVIASGRPYPTLQTNFGPVANRLSYITDNGALVYHNNELIFKDVMDKNVIKDIIKEARKIKNIAIVLCGVECAYLENFSDEYLEQIHRFYVRYEVVDDISKVEDDIIKVTLCDLDHAIKNSNPVIEPLFGNNFNVVITDKFWLDITNKTVNKGTALRKIMEHGNIIKEETMAFGNYYNDIEMLNEAEYSFVMKNAPEDMKQHSKYIAESNEDYGVLGAIMEHVVV
ncbi:MULTISPECIES: Cof-type HAD-IIB family hydrolase [unclassified Clostridium]|uniref:Cof-type HAD-IIB family hydrolase n=1 Tax=unclassified Clostridium TaxID=2614128 RepID=UPI00030E5793|nr:MULTISPECIES: Cof-type HAD-IIB family hydrolase [unclassified Clostridium]MBN1051287.1 Cof-type HAD-IIB family hydrolase [Clostridium botulinum]NFN92879.1 Cof-type HAD-IIB family hydrolase [Clostridium botulinum]NFR89266.1 Cof-type HAD-IIB family hydrolase [Clostridium botulinum]NFS95741.1 Cof-type HAD-IIB family hydrolase [Clostridium botulinum]NFT97668.1 Cof-type HAD-IIB family hydrolase [Clostridium botulinum]